MDDGTFDLPLKKTIDSTVAQRWHAPDRTLLTWRERNNYYPIKPHYPIDQHHYLPLAEDEIRVLFLQRAKHIWDPIHATVKHGPLHWNGDFQPYLTLSYAWDNSTPRPPEWSPVIHCEGLVIIINRNLEIALRYIRDRFDDLINDLYAMRPGGDAMLYVPIWIDALCINQADATEKGHQVSRMAEIYSNASRLIIWLGAPNPPLRPVFQSLSGDLVWHHINELASSGLLGSRWFSRRWVIQEYCLTPSHSRFFLFGPLLFDGFGFGNRIGKLPPHLKFRLANFLKDFPAWVRDPGRTAPRDGPNSLLLKLYIYADAACSNTHDLVYALLSLAGGSGEITDIDVDYTQSIEALFEAVARSILEARSERLDRLGPLLAVASTRRHTFTSRQLPSWVPDWRTSTQYKFEDHEAGVSDMMCRLALENRAHDNPIAIQFQALEQKLNPPLIAINGRQLSVAGRFLETCFPPRHKKNWLLFQAQDSYGTPVPEGTQRCWTCEFFRNAWGGFTSETKKALSMVDGQRQFLFVFPRSDGVVFVLNNSWPPSESSVNHFEIAYCVPTRHQTSHKVREQFFSTLDTIVIE